MSVAAINAEQAPSSAITAMERALSLHIRQSFLPFPIATHRSAPRERTILSFASMAEPFGNVRIVSGSPLQFEAAVPWVSAVRT